MQVDTFGKYTQELENAMWDVVGREYDREYDFAELVAELNSPDFARPFSERLLVFYNDVSGSSFNASEAAKDLRRRADLKGLSMNRGTVNNWFSGGTEPRYGGDDRQRLFTMAFALELDVRQTDKLFQKVFLDAAFNKRNINEFIYLYCIYNKKPMSVAEDLISKTSIINIAAVPADHTVQTQVLAETAMRDAGKNEIIEYILAHPHNFSLNHTAAKKKRVELLDDLRGDVNQKGLARQEHERRPELADGKNKVKTSVDFMLSVLKDADFVQKDSKDIILIREKFPQRKEIYNKFPDKQTLSEKDPSSYALRKDIILLYFFWYWVKDFLYRQEHGKERGPGEYDDFVENLRSTLFDCGFSPLYVGNPYDWLFLYCSACSDRSNPLDVFRGILAPD